MKATIILNPRAGKRGLNGDLDPALRVLENAGWTLTVERTSAPSDATTLAQQAVDAGMEAVLVAGGDGTINEAIQALAGTDTAFGYLPYGTVNIWAREVDIPLHVERAAHEMANGRVEQIDLGLAGDRYFLLMAGIGFDGEVVRRTQEIEHHKGRFGILPYVLAGITTIPLYRGADVELRFDGIIRRVQALMLVAGNTRLYGGRFHLTPNAVANDGWLDVSIIKGRGPIALARQSFPVLVLGSVDRADVEFLKVRELTVQSDEPVPVQVDGEPAGTTPLVLKVAPRALKAIVPASLKSDLIG